MLSFLVLFLGVAFAQPQYAASVELLPATWVSELPPELGDVDGDGVLDVVVASAHSVRWSRSDGLSPATWTETLIAEVTSASITRLGVADLDADGDADVLLGADSGDLFWYQNLAAGTAWQAQGTWATSTYPLAPFVFGDFNGDGLLDAASCGASGAEWYDASQMFQATGLLHSCDMIVAGDLDGDGDTDLGLAGASGTVRWLENDGAGSFLGHLLSSSAPSVWGLALADLDGDGDGELLVTDGSQGTVQAIEAATGETWAAVSGTSATAVLVGDTDGDGDQDLWTQRWQEPGLDRWTNPGGAVPSLTLAHTIDPPLRGGGPRLGDFDGDGDLDLVQQQGSSSYAAWQDDGAWSLSWPAFARPPAIELVEADLDGDGVAELVGLCSHNLFVGTSAGPPMDVEVVGPLLRDCDDVAAGDVDGDGLVDLVARCPSYPSSMDIVAFLQAGGWAEEVVGTFPEGAWTLGDLDGDGDAEVVVDEYTSLLQLDRGSTGWSASTLGSPVPSEPVLSLHAGDLNGDGEVDLFAGMPSGGYGFLNPGSSSATWVSELLYTPSSGTVTVHAMADLEGDGDLDVAVSWQTAASEGWAVNPGGAGAWSFSATLITTPATASDLDGDGDVDLAGLDSSVAWTETVDAAAGQFASGWAPSAADLLAVGVADLLGGPAPDLIYSTLDGAVYGLEGLQFAPGDDDDIAADDDDIAADDDDIAADDDDTATDDDDAADDDDTATDDDDTATDDDDTADDDDTTDDDDAADDDDTADDDDAADDDDTADDDDDTADDDDDDTATTGDDDDDSAQPEGGCSCAHAPPSAGLAVLLVFLRRRRPRPTSHAFSGG